MNRDGPTLSDASCAAALDGLDAALDQVAKLDFWQLGSIDQVKLLQRLEVVSRRIPAVGNEIINRLEQDCAAPVLGHRNVRQLLAEALLITRGEAGARTALARDLGTRTSFTGETLPPHLPCTSEAQRTGAISVEHAKIIRRFMHELPAKVECKDRERAEEHLADLATCLRPDELIQAADHLAVILNPDGTYSDIDRQRLRSLSMKKHGPDKLTVGGLTADPELAAYLDAIFTKWARKGVNNPDDPASPLDGSPGDESVAADRRTQNQRQHDALKTALRQILQSGALGQHRGLPTTVIVTAKLSEIEAAAKQAARQGNLDGLKGTGFTAGGKHLPMADLLRMAAHSIHYLAVFADADSRPLYLGRTRRLASPDQRIAVIARDQGCSFPGCTSPAYWTQVHHTVEWADLGPTNADLLTLACDEHHPQVGTGQYRTVLKGGRTQWIAPPNTYPRPRSTANHYFTPHAYRKRQASPARE